ncbi:hypothetical protein F2P79_003908 [Pimephales promelas]|nr:hypothetical protein F2P79_003908 [Pimephales promelas]
MKFLFKLKTCTCTWRSTLKGEMHPQGFWMFAIIAPIIKAITSTKPFPVIADQTCTSVKPKHLNRAEVSSLDWATPEGLFSCVEAIRLLIYS